MMTLNRKRQQSSDPFVRAGWRAVSPVRARKLRNRGEDVRWFPEDGTFMWLPEYLTPEKVDQLAEHLNRINLVITADCAPAFAGLQKALDALIEARRHAPAMPHSLPQRTREAIKLREAYRAQHPELIDTLVNTDYRALEAAAANAYDHGTQENDDA